MAYTTKELSQKYDGLWDQMDGVYKDMSSLTEYVGEIDEKYNAIWGKVESVHSSNASIEQKYDILSGKCDYHADSIRTLMESSSQLSILKGKFDLMKYDMGAIQNTLRKFDKMEDEHIAMMSNMHYDMHEMQNLIHKYKKYNDNKISWLYTIIVITISIIIYLCS
jgi:hypothetical protein